MKACLFALAALILILIRAQAAPEAAQSAPEFEALRSSYQRNLATIESARQSRTEPIRRSYAADLELLQREVTTNGDLDGALQVKAERERLAAERDPTAEERKAMQPALSARRTRYEKEMEPIITMIRNALDQQKTAYVAALDGLQRRFTVQNQLEQATAVRAERESIVGPTPEKPAPESASTSAATLSPSAVAGIGQLDPAFAEKIATAIRDGKLARTALSREKESGGNETIKEGAVLVGFEFFETKTNGLPDVRSLRPIYLTSNGIQAGGDRGRMEKVTSKVLARPGYAVGGIYVYYTNNIGRIQGIQVVFMKIIPAEARLDHDSSNTYRSLWFGSIPHKDKPKELGGDGRPVVGVYGFHGADCDVIGLVQMAE